MRSPAPAFDLRTALARELCDALGQLDTAAANPKAVHRCRVHIKRARALAKVGRICAPGLAAIFNQSARATMRSLAQSRDAAALTEAAQAASLKAGKKNAAPLGALVHTLNEASAAADAPDIQGARTSLKDLLALAQVWPEASPRQIRRSAERIERRARRARRRGLHSADNELLHVWRKREKDRFYAAEFLAAAWPYRRLRKPSEKLTAILGDIRDVGLLRDRIEAAALTCGSPKADRLALRALEQRLGKLHKQLDRLGEKLRRKRA